MYTINQICEALAESEVSYSEATDVVKRLQAMKPRTESEAANEAPATQLTRIFAPFANDADAAACIREAAETVDENAKAWEPGGEHGGPDGDADMVSMYHDDAAALRGIADVLNHAGSAAALEAASRLDTACRDEIPKRAWVYLGGEINETWKWAS